jgi:hypothetical protein
VQPYRGRDENLFSFFTLMFLIVLIHTSLLEADGIGLQVRRQRLST